MSKNSKKQAQQGTYALCITTGLMLGFGIGAMMENALLLALAGAAIGAGVAYRFNQSRRPHRH